MTTPTRSHALSVLVVDDSAVYRRILTGVVEEIEGAELIGTASNGRLALERISLSRPDIVLLDVEMPEMNGLETLESIRARFPETGVVMISSMGKRAADITVAALEKGALDFITKPDGASQEENRRTLVERLSPILWTFNAKRGLSVSRRQEEAPKSTFARLAPCAAPAAYPKEKASAPTPTAAEPSGSKAASIALKHPVDVVLIGISTGGPNALAVLIPALPRDLGVPVLVVQHMPPVFTASLAKSLAKKSKIPVTEAAEDQVIENGTVYIAPGGKHMVVRREKDGGRYAIGLNENPPENSCRPAVDVLFRSAATLYGGSALAVIMTGMGQDGLNGVKSLKQRGAHCLTQDETSCTIYGMPLAVDKAGLSDESLPLDDLAGRITQLVQAGKKLR